MHSLDKYNHVDTNVFYVTGNIPGAGIDSEDFESEFSVGCKCQSICDNTCSCSRGTVNYANDRIVMNQSKLMMECNPHCSCSANCGNRLVQKGPLDCLVVMETERKGLGLFTREPILKGQFICEYAGEIIGLEEAVARFEMKKTLGQQNYVLVVVEFLGDKKVTTCVDPSQLGNIGRYCNHNCTPNAEIVTIRVERLTPRFCLFAVRDIKAFEEITFHYAGGSTQSVHCFSETPCACGSPQCQGYLPHQLV